MAGKGKNIHDTFTKKAFANEKVSREFFELNLPATILKEVDLSTLKQEKESYVEHTLGHGIVDLIFSVNFAKEKGYLVLLLEQQSTQRYNMPLRIQKYVLRFASEYLDKHKKKKIPLIYPLLLYTGNKKYTAPLSLYSLFKDEKKAKEYLTNPIQLIEVSGFSKDDIRGKYWAGMLMYFMDKIHQKDIFPYIREVTHIIGKVSEEGDIEFIKTVLYYIIERADSDEVEGIFSEFRKSVATSHQEEIMTIAERLREQGREQGKQAGMQLGRESGIQIGMQKGVKRVAHNMLLKNMDEKTIMEATGLTLAELKKLRMD